MERANRLAEVLQQIDQKKRDLSALEDEARELVRGVAEDLGISLGTAVPRGSNTKANGAKGPHPRRGDISDRERVILVVNEASRPVRLDDIERTLQEIGTPIPRASIRSYLTGAARDGKVRRVRGKTGLYKALPKGPEAADE